MARPLDTARLGDHLDRLYRAACALTGSRATADNLVQETYARVLSRRRMIRNEDDVGYLLRTMRNVFLGQYRTGKRRRTDRTAKRRAPDPTDPEARDRMVRGGGPKEAVEHRELLAAIGALPEDFRDVI